MNVQCGPEMHYTYGGAESVVANLRDTYQGLMVCVADSNPGTDYTYGVISICFDLELFDPLPVPLSTSSTSVASVEEATLSTESDGPAPSRPADTPGTVSGFTLVGQSPTAVRPVLSATLRSNQK